MNDNGDLTKNVGQICVFKLPVSEFTLKQDKVQQVLLKTKTASPHLTFSSCENDRNESIYTVLALKSLNFLVNL